MSVTTTRLTNAEADCTVLYALGHSSQTSADLRHCSKSTVDFHRLNVLRVMGARSMAEVVGMLAASGELTFRLKDVPT